MAVYTYYNVYTAKSYADRVDLLTTGARRLLNSGILDEVKNRLDDQILSAMEYEEKICDKLHAKNLDELRARLLQYRDAVVNFSGPKLVSLINEYKFLIDKDQQLFERAVNKVFQRDIWRKIEQNLNTLGDGVLDALGKTYLDYLQDNSVIGGRFRSLDAIVRDGAGNFHINVLNFTPAQKRVWKKIIDDEMGRGKDGKKLKARQRRFRAEIMEDKLTYDPSIHHQSLAINFYMVPQSIDTKENEAAVLELINRIVDLANPEAQPLIRSICEHIYHQNKNAFYIGDNPNQIIGLLGEIQATYYVAMLYGAKNNNVLQELPPQITWQGGAQSGANNTKPHIDVLLEDLIGIQVKNSTRDLQRISDINFRRINIQSLFNEVAGLNPDIKDLVTNYFGTKGFNVDYDVQVDENGRKTFIHGGPVDWGEPTSIYLMSKAILNSSGLANDINRLLTLCIESFMYIKTAETSEKVDLNSLYILGGATLYAVSEILIKLRDAIEKEAPSSFKVNSEYNDITIVESLNHSHQRMNSDLMNATSHDIQSRLARGGGHSKSDLVAANIILTSSFNFGDLL